MAALTYQWYDLKESSKTYCNLALMLENEETSERKMEWNKSIHLNDSQI